VQLPPLLDVMRTVVAATEPLVADGPNALTQSPTAKVPADAACVALTVVEPDVVIVSVCVLGAVGFLAFDLELDVRERPNEPPESVIPETVMVEPLTAVTLPEAMSSDAKALRKLLAPDPEGNDGRVPLVPLPGRKAKPPPAKLGRVPLPPKLAAPLPAHVPADVGEVTVKLRAVRLVLELFEAVPVAVTQSPTATEPTDSVTVWENFVVPLQVTVVWPLEGFCTSMLEAPSAATLPLAPLGALAVAAADAGTAAATTATATTAALAPTAIAPVPRHRAQRPLLGRRLVGVCMWMFPLSLLVLQG